MNTTPRALFSVGTGPVQTLDGVYAGIVYSTNDPLRQNRIQAQVPQVLGTATSNWAEPVCQPSNSSIPAVGSHVLITFIGGDRNYPAYFPQAWVTSIPVPLQLTAPVGPVLEVNVTGDTKERFTIDTNGKLQWGTGSATQDTDLYRYSAGVLATDGAFNAISLTTNTVITVTDGSAPVTPSLSSVLYSSSGHTKYASSDGNYYDTGFLVVYLTSDQGPINSTTPTPITQLSGLNVAATTYRIRGSLSCININATATQAVRFTFSGTYTAMNIMYQSFEGGSVLSSGVALSTANNLSWGSIPGSTTGEMNFSGIFTFSSIGLFGMSALCVTSGADTWSVGQGSWLELTPLT